MICFTCKISKGVYGISKEDSLMKLAVRLFEDDGTFSVQEEKLKGIANIELKPSSSEEEIIKNAKDADFLIVGYEQITPKVMDSLPNLKMVCFQSIGVNGINLNEANIRNIPVAHISTYCVPEVADYVLACILAENRKIYQFNDNVKNDKEWIYDKFPKMRRLGNQTVGLLGFGNIPRTITERLKAFGCDVIAYDPFISEEVFESYGVKSATMEEIFENSDYISCHLPLMSATENIIDEKLFDITNNSPVFINSARGGVVKESALIDALDNDKVSFAYLDVLQSETPNLETDPLVLHAKTILTPHSAFYSEDSMQQSGIDTVDNIIHYVNKNYDSIDLVNRKNIEIK